MSKLTLLLLSFSLLGACTTTTIDQYRQGDTFLSEGETVVVLGRRHNSDYETEPGFVDCVSEYLSKDKQVTVVSEADFVDGMYPWFEARTAPLRLSSLDKLKQKSPAASKMDDFGIRYIVWIDGSTETVDSMGSITCGIGTGGAGCYGFGSWQDDAKYEATIWDVDRMQSVGKISTDATGTSYMPAVVVPIPLIARVEANACKGLGGQLQQFLQPEQG